MKRIALIVPPQRPARHHLARLALALRTWASRAVNAWRLRTLPGHRARVRQARYALTVMRGFGGDRFEARCFAYLRRVDPLVAEELVLTALEDAGSFVLRNRRYTGDGGVDGRVWLPGWGLRSHAIQVKRYSSCISAQHIAELAAAVRVNRHAGGLFVHCGRTGPTSYAQLKVCHDVRVVSGAGLIALLRRGQLPVLPASRDSA